MARRRGFGGGRGPDYNWNHFGDVNNANDLGTSVSVLGSTSLVFSGAQTIVRIRGKVGCILDTGGVNESTMLLVGLTILNADAVASGVAPELMTPASGGDDGNWIWQGALWVNSGAEAAVVPDALSDSVEVDTKAMRRVKSNESLAFVFQTAAELTVDATGTIDITYFMHVLTAA